MVGVHFRRSLRRSACELLSRFVTFLLKNCPSLSSFLLPQCGMLHNLSSSTRSQPTVDDLQQFQGRDKCGVCQCTGGLVPLRERLMLTIRPQSPKTAEAKPHRWATAASQLICVFLLLPDACKETATQVRESAEILATTPLASSLKTVDVSKCNSHTTLSCSMTPSLSRLPSFPSINLLEIELGAPALVEHRRPSQRYAGDITLLFVSIYRLTFVASSCMRAFKLIFSAPMSLRTCSRTQLKKILEEKGTDI